LKQARKKRDTAKKQIADGIDPGYTRKQERSEKAAAIDRKKRLDAGLPIINSFEHIAREWLASIAHTVRDISHQKKIRRLDLHSFPFIGAIPINEIKSPDIYNVIKPLITKNELERAHRVHSDISAAFSYAIAHGMTDYDPAQAVAAQIPPQKAKHRAALTEPKDAAQLLRDICNYQGTFVVQCDFRLSPLGNSE
jgi:hypothetical protein